MLQFSLPGKLLLVWELFMTQWKIINTNALTSFKTLRDRA